MFNLFGLFGKKKETDAPAAPVKAPVQAAPEIKEEKKAEAPARAEAPQAAPKQEAKAQAPARREAPAKPERQRISLGGGYGRGYEVGTESAEPVKEAAPERAERSERPERGERRQYQSYGQRRSYDEGGYRSRRYDGSRRYDEGGYERRSRYDREGSSEESYGRQSYGSRRSYGRYDRYDRQSRYDSDKYENDFEDKYEAAPRTPEEMGTNIKDEPATDVILKRAEDFLQEIFAAMHLEVEIYRRETEDGTLYEFAGDRLGILIGKHGQTLDALQYLTGLAANKDHSDGHAHIILDIEGYRSRREDTLMRLAGHLAEKACRIGQEIHLEPMNRHERKIIHTALQTNHKVSTYSAGEEPRRYVVIVPRRSRRRRYDSYESYNNDTEE